MIRPGKLHHAALRVADFERSRTFYEGLLGMSTVPRPDLGFPGLGMVSATDSFT